MGNDLESRVAAIERELAAARRADLAEIRAVDGPEVAELVAALKVRAAEFRRWFTVSTWNTEERRVALCVSCGRGAGVAELAKAPFPHTTDCPLAAPLQTGG